MLDFESESELDQLTWKCYTFFSLSEEHETHGTHSLRMELFPSAYPGVKPKLKDWRKFKAINFDVYNPEKEEIKIHIRVDDQKGNPGYSDRYNKRLVLKPGPNHIGIPLDSLMTSDTQKPLNLKKNHKLIIFYGPATEKICFLCCLYTPKRSDCRSYRIYGVRCRPT